MKRIAIVLMAVVMMISMMSVMTAVAADLTNGIAGAWGDKADTPITQTEKKITIKKELKSYNPTSGTVLAPEFYYIYTVTPAAVGKTVTDSAEDHVIVSPVTAPVKAGPTAGLIVSTTTTPGTAGDGSSAIGTLVFTNATGLNSSKDGTVNTYDITLDFSGVSFAEPGVYRYEITESLPTDVSFAKLAINDNNEASDSKVRYLDVYVDGNSDIYGFVCIPTNDNVTPSTETSKTNGFVLDSDGQDEYYTYDLTLSKTVVGDAYAKDNHAFPLTVIFDNTEEFGACFKITETAKTGSTGISPAAGTLTGTPNWSGVALVKDSCDITYTGIPCGVDVYVYETNDVTGTTYTVSTVVNGGTAVVDNSVAWGAAPSSAVAQSTRKEYESKKAKVDTTEFTKVEAVNVEGAEPEQSIAITNTLLLISPTGVMVRVAPYVIILAAGITLLLISRRRRHEVKD